MYELLGICLFLATFLAANTVAAFFAAALWRACSRLAQRVSAHTRAELLFALRVAPTALALAFVGLLIVPAYLSYEPYETTEVVSKKLAAVAFLSALSVAIAFWRLSRSMFATHSLLRAWLRDARPVRIPGIGIPAFEIQHSFPIIAVVGTSKPRLFVASRVLRRLTTDELAAAIAHEHGHLRARDNLKRSLLGTCRNILIVFPFGRAIDHAWSEAAEAAADEHAARKDAGAALNLASALVKIAKMVPAGARADLPLAAYLVGAEETQGVQARVKRLLEIASSDCAARYASLNQILPTAVVAFMLLLVTAASANPRVLLTVHDAIERAVSLLC